MKRWGTNIVVALVVICALADSIGEFYANDTINYFALEPRRLFYVAGIAVAGALLALAVSRLSEPAQRSLRLFGWGAAASLLTAGCGYAIYQSGSLSPVILENAGARWLPLVPLLLAGMAAYFWFEFFRGWKTRDIAAP